MSLVLHTTHAEDNNTDQILVADLFFAIVYVKYEPPNPDPTPKLGGAGPSSS